MDFGTTLIFSILFGSIGMGYFVYGKKQQAALPLLAGIVLCIFPYFVSSVYIMVLVGVVLTVLPWVL
jgi:predicted membrane metal-binding protein